MNKKKIYVTGVTGFIGSKIAETCVKNKFNVIGISRKSSKEVKEIKKKLGIKILKNDLLDKKKLFLEGAETIVHCATANDLISKNFDLGMNLSIMGTKKILEAAIKAKIKNFIFISTAQVYGTELNGIINEKSKLNCQTQYSLNHYFGEELCKMYSKKFGIKVVVLRPSNIYGLPLFKTVDRSSLVPMCFVKSGFKSKSIDILSSGKQMRNFVSCDQLSNSVLDILKNFPSRIFTIINIGSNWCSSIKEIAKLTRNSFEKKKLKIKLKILSKKPDKSNHFSYESIYFKYKDHKKICRNYMIKTIDSLIDRKKI